jgi:hypothetical protein
MNSRDRYIEEEHLPPFSEADGTPRLPVVHRAKVRLLANISDFEIVAIGQALNFYCITIEALTDYGQQSVTRLDLLCPEYFLPKIPRALSAGLKNSDLRSVELSSSMPFNATSIDLLFEGLMLADFVDVADFLRAYLPKSASKKDFLFLLSLVLLLSACCLTSLSSSDSSRLLHGQSS